MGQTKNYACDACNIPVDCEISSSPEPPVIRNESTPYPSSMLLTAELKEAENFSRFFVILVFCFGLGLSFFLMHPNPLHIL